MYLYCTVLICTGLLLLILSLFKLSHLCVLPSGNILQLYLLCMKLKQSFLLECIVWLLITLTFLQVTRCSPPSSSPPLPIRWTGLMRRPEGRADRLVSLLTCPIVTFILLFISSTIKIVFTIESCMFCYKKYSHTTYLLLKRMYNSTFLLGLFQFIYTSSLFIL